jgi:hypothetical protein
VEELMILVLVKVEVGFVVVVLLIVVEVLVLNTVFVELEDVLMLSSNSIIFLFP